MLKNKIIDEFNQDIFCNNCNTITEHKVQRVEDRYIEFYGECDVCGDVIEISKSELCDA